MEPLDCIVIGAGVIGLAVARALALAGREVIVLEACDCIGGGISSRNSEVIHAGIYYPAESLKAKFCVEGRRQLYEYCENRHIPFRRCGKLIIATDDSQHDALRATMNKARANGVEDIVWLEPRQALEIEPAIRCSAALWSPSTGILDSHGYMLALQGDLENAGGMVVFNTCVVSASVVQGELRLNLKSDADEYQVGARTVVNSAGLASDRLARSIEGIKLEAIPVYRYAKGNYFTCAGQSPFSSLIYPLPGEHGLGVHVTHDMGGKLRFGPDVEWIDEIDYEVDPARCESFYEAIRQYWPGLPDGSLQPAYSGIRPKITGPGQPAADFIIQDASEHRVPGLINLFGIESPGLTSSLALADHVRQLAG